MIINLYIVTIKVNIFCTSLMRWNMEINCKQTQTVRMGGGVGVWGHGRGMGGHGPGM